MKNTIFKGMATAIVTPMKADLSIDYDALARFIEFQIENGINAIVVMGTTGENATIEPEDQALTTPTMCCTTPKMPAKWALMPCWW